MFKLPHEAMHGPCCTTSLLRHGGRSKPCQDDSQKAWEALIIGRHREMQDPVKLQFWCQLRVEAVGHRPLTFRPRLSLVFPAGQRQAVAHGSGTLLPGHQRGGMAAGVKLVSRSVARVLLLLKLLPSNAQCYLRYLCFSFESRDSGRKLCKLQLFNASAASVTCQGWTRSLPV